MAEIMTVRADQVKIGDEFYNKYAKTGWEAVEFVDQCYTTKRVTIHLRTSKKTYEADTMLSVRRDEKKRATLSDPSMNYACWQDVFRQCVEIPASRWLPSYTMHACLDGGYLQVVVRDKCDPLPGGAETIAYDFQDKGEAIISMQSGMVAFHIVSRIARRFKAASALLGRGYTIGSNIAAEAYL